MTIAINLFLVGSLLPSLFDAQVKIVPSDAIARDSVGMSVAVSGDLAVVGTPRSDDASPEGSRYNSGSAFLFRRNMLEPNHWQEVAALTPADLSAGDSFGGSVAISNDVAVVGAAGNDDACPEDPGCNSGAVYLIQIDNRSDATETHALKLRASDATEGSWFGQAVSISGDTTIVGAAGAAYIFQRDGDRNDAWLEVGKLIAPDPENSSRFGFSVAISGDTAVVGAYGSNRRTGVAHLFRRDEGGSDNWGHFAVLTTEFPEPRDCFGAAVSLSGDFAIVGATCPERIGRRPGMAHIFGRNYGGPDHWGRMKSLTMNEENLAAYFGSAVSIHDDLAIVGAPGASGSCSGVDECQPGAAYVFQQNQGGPDNWGQLQVLSAFDAADRDEFARSVAIGDGTIVIGAPEDSDRGLATGAAYVFYESVCGNGFVEGPEECDDVTESATCDRDCTFAECGDGRLNELAGETCDGTEDLACDGSPCRSDCSCRPLTCGNGIRDPGEACDGTESKACGSGRCTSDCLCRLSKPIELGGDDCRIKRLDTLSASDAERGDGFGFSVSISRGVAVVGAPWSDDGPEGPYECCSGSAYIYRRSPVAPEHWIETAKLIASDVSKFDGFGGSVAVNGNTAVIGAGGNDDACSDDTPSCNSGAAYVFERSDLSLSEWLEPVKLSASDAEADAFFGRSVAITGDTIVVGAPGSFSGDLQGAAYVYQRHRGDPETWVEVVKLTPSDGVAYGRFGSAVAINQDTVVVGAWGSDGACPGDPYCRSGSAYVFQRNWGGTDRWGEVAKLTASDEGPNHQFGSSVSTYGDTMIVGAPGNDSACPGYLYCYSGAAYIFQRDQGGPNHWGQVMQITPSDAVAGDAFGHSVSIAGDSVVVGAYDGEIGGPHTANAYVFRRHHGGMNAWGEVAKLSVSEHDREDAFGLSVSISGETALIGAPYWSDIVSGAGGVHVFDTSSCGDGTVKNPAEHGDPVTTIRLNGVRSTAEKRGHRR